MSLTSNNGANNGPKYIFDVWHHVALVFSTAYETWDDFPIEGGWKGDVGLPDNDVDTLPNDDSHILKIVNSKAGDFEPVLRSAGNFLNLFLIFLVLLFTLLLLLFLLFVILFLILFLILFFFVSWSSSYGFYYSSLYSHSSLPSYFSRKLNRKILHVVYANQYQ